MDKIDKFFAWLLKRSTKSKLAIIMAFALFLKMVYDLLGLGYLSQSFEDSMTDILIGEVIAEFIPIDIVTILIGALALMFANYGLKHSDEWISVARISKWGAIILMILSFTPVPTVLQTMTTTLVFTDTKVKVDASQKNYEEFSKYVDVSPTIILTSGGTEADVEQILRDNIQEVEGAELLNMTVENDHGYIRVLLEVEETAGKKEIEYYITLEEADYPEAYFRMKYNGTTAYPCKEELDFSYSFEFGNYKFGYATMMYHQFSGRDTIYASAKAENGQKYTYVVMLDSTSMYRSFSPSLAAEKPSELTALPEYCKTLVYEMCDYLPKRATQMIETSETVVVSGITMQKATGSITGEKYGGNGEEVTLPYIAYYFFVEEDGETYPAVMLGIADEPILDVLEAYLNQSVEYIEIIDTEIIDTETTEM